MKPLLTLFATATFLTTLCGCPPGTNSGNIRLTLVLAADMPDSRGHAVYVFVDDVEHTRESAPFDDVTRLVRTFRAENGMDETSFDVEAGKVITLVAFDGGHSVVGAQNIVTGDPFFSNPALNEFVDFGGAETSAVETGFGVIAFRAAVDRTVTTNFRRMPLVVVNQVVLSGIGSPGATGVEASIADYLGFPGEEERMPTPAVQTYPITVALSAQVRTGSTITLTAMNIGESEFVRWDGYFACGSDPMCVLDTQDGSLTVMENWRTPDF